MQRENSLVGQNRLHTICTEMMVGCVISTSVTLKPQFKIIQPKIIKMSFSLFFGKLF